MNYGGVYEIVDTTTGKRYVGSSKNVSYRLRYHKSCLRSGNHFNPMLQRAYSIRPDAFVFSPIAYLEVCEQLLTEQRLLDIEHAKGRNTFNIAKDALACMKGRKHTNKWSEESILWKVGNKSKTGIPGPFKGMKLTEEQKARRKKPPPVTDETRAKMRLARLGVSPANKGIHSGVCRNGHAKTPENTYVHVKKSGAVAHYCRQCMADREVRYNQERKRGT